MKKLQKIIAQARKKIKEVSGRIRTKFVCHRPRSNKFNFETTSLEIITYDNGVDKKSYYRYKRKKN